MFQGFVREDIETSCHNVIVHLAVPDCGIEFGEPRSAHNRCASTGTNLADAIDAKLNTS